MSCLSNINAKTDIEKVMDMFKSLNDGMVTRAAAMEAAVVLMGAPSTAAAGAAAASAAESVFASVSLADMEAKRIEMVAAEAMKRATMLKSCKQIDEFLEKIVKLK